ncbi:SnoaL-like domain protein [Bacillus sp. THAF10]|nr:SnoaL-like domain protein [Bacillus sp. THAF10]
MNANKDQAISFLTLIVEGRISEAFERYSGPDFLHHNPYFKGDAHSLMVAMEENAKESPNKTMEIHHAVEENNTVVIHSHIKQHHEDLGAAVVHIFRFHDNKIAEVWDTGQAVPQDSPNENGMF